MNWPYNTEAYYSLTKPGIIKGNLLSVTAGFFLASSSLEKLELLLITLVGSALVIASGCVFNNVMDIEIDKKMPRTASRALPSATISKSSALIFGSLLGLLGLLALSLYVNKLTALVGLTGLFFYVILYGIFKRRSIYGTLVGSISGAIPPVAGYTAFSSRLDVGAVLIFLTLASWQMPHFYAIAIYRLKEYKSAGIPLWSIVRGLSSTKKQMIFFICLYLIFMSLLTARGLTGLSYLFINLALGSVWLFRAWTGFKQDDSNKWARKMFGFSLLVLLVWTATIILNIWLP